MTKAAIARAALQLPVEDQLELAQTLWDRASPPSDFELTPELKELLEARRQEALENPGAGVPWDEVRDRLLKRA